MNMPFTRVLGCLSLAVLGFLTDLPAHAASGMPYGRYATESCKEPGSFVIFTELFESYGDADGYASIARTEPPEAVANGWYVAKAKDYAYFYRVDTAGNMQAIEPADAGSALTAMILNGQILPSDQLLGDPQWNGFNYMPCDTLGQSLELLYGEAWDIMLALDGALRACNLDQSKCVPEIFRVLDRHPDGALRIAEIARAIRFLIYLGIGLGSDWASSDDWLAGYSASLPVAPLLAAALIGSYDYNGDGGLSPEELLSSTSDSMALALSGGFSSTSGLQGLSKEARQAIDSISQMLMGGPR